MLSTEIHAGVALLTDAQGRRAVGLPVRDERRGVAGATKRE